MSSKSRPGPERFMRPGHPLRLILVPLSWLYIGGLRLFLLPYALGLRKQHRLSEPVVCIGNLTFGGTGKTPAVVAIAREMQSQGLRPVIISRGHGGKLCLKGAVVSEGAGRILDVEDSGDEPALISDLLPGVPVLIGKDRVRIGKLAIERFAPDLLLMDDGMQYWQLYKDLTVVVMNASEPFGTGGVLPAGTLREPVSGLGRAGAVIVTGSDRLDAKGRCDLESRVRRINAGVPVFYAKHKPDELYRHGEGGKLPLEYLTGREVMALSSIGSPASFEATLETLGADVVETLRFADHHSYTDDDLTMIRCRCGEADVVTTEKDATRLPPEKAGNPLVLSVRLDIERLSELVRVICRSITT